MKIYLPEGSTRDRRLHVEPGKDHPENSAWFAVDGRGNPDPKAPLMITVQFQDGRAEVESGLGRYLIDKGLAQRSALILPPTVRDPTAEERTRPAPRIYGAVA